MSELTSHLQQLFSTLDARWATKDKYKHILWPTIHHLNFFWTASHLYSSYIYLIWLLLDAFVVDNSWLFHFKHILRKVWRLTKKSSQAHRLRNTDLQSVSQIKTNEEKWLTGCTYLLNQRLSQKLTKYDFLNLFFFAHFE